MSLIDDNGQFIYKGPMSARIACCFGGTERPIICTLLGDQPLFYIDDAASEMEDAFLSEAAMFDDKVASEGFSGMRTKMARIEAAGRHIDNYTRDDVETAFDAVCQSLNAAPALTIEQVRAGLQLSRFAVAMMQDLEAKGITMMLSRQIDRAVYDRVSRTVFVNPHQDVDFAVTAAVGAIRQAWLHLQGALIHPLHLNPENAIVLNRIQTVDSLCATLRAAWEMNLNGARTVWTRIISGTGYDMASSFGREAISDFRALNNGEAARSAFEKWFFSGRCRMTDRNLIQSMLSDHHGLVFDDSGLTAALSQEVIARTGEMPLGRNYLAPIVDMVLADPLFTEVRDRSNANFLWFIKFEKSFRHAEEGLRETAQVAYPVMEGSSATAEQTADAVTTVITFPLKTAKPSSRRRKTGTGDSATVFYIDHFFGLHG